MNSLLSRFGYSTSSVVEDNRVEFVETLMHEFGSELEAGLGFDNVDAQEDYDGYDDFYADRDSDDVYNDDSTVSVELETLRDDTCIDRFVFDSDLDTDNTALGMDMSSNVFGFDHVEENVCVPLDSEPLVVDNDVGLGWEEVNDGVVQFIDMGIQLVEDGNDDSASIGGGEAAVDMAWQVLSNGNFEVMSPEHAEEFVRPFYHEDDLFMDTAEYDTMIEQIVENENALLGLLPASTNVVNNLHEVTISEADLVENDNVVVCAVCKDEMNVGGKAKQLPCGHRYHGDCILPWLVIRNTCPVCRHELPTDNAHYEARRALRARQMM